VDYAAVHECIATPSAPPGVSTAVQLRSSGAMDAIFGAASVIATVRGQMFQSPGDKTISASPSPLVRGESTVSARKAAAEFRGSLVRSVMSSPGRVLRRRAEGFWDFDWLKHGNVGPINWDFRDKPSSRGREVGARGHPVAPPRPPSRR
jgi:hypothetical protein